MNKVLALFYKLPGSFFLGGIVALGLMHNDPWLKKRVERFIIATVTDLVGRPFSIQVSDIDLLRGELVMHSASLVSANGDWSFRAPTMRMHVSWLKWISGKGFATGVTFEQPTFTTDYNNGTFAAEEPFNALMNAPFTLPLYIRHYRTVQGTVSIRTPLGTVQSRCSGTSRVTSESVVTRIRCTDGSALYGDSLFAQHLNGDVTIDVPHDDTPYILTMKLVCDRVHGRCLPYHLYYRFANERGMCRWRAEDGSLAVQADSITYTPDETVASLLVAGDLKEIASYGIDDSPVICGTGTFKGTGRATEDGYSYDGLATVKDVVWGTIPVQSAQMKLRGTDNKVSVQNIDAVSCGMSLKGSLTAFNAPQVIKGELSLAKPYDGIAQCTLSKGRAQFAYKDTQLTADMSCEGTVMSGGSIPLRGKFTTDFSSARLKGTWAGNPVHLEADLNPFCVTHFSIKDHLRNPRLSLEKIPEKRGVQGMLDGALIKMMVHAITGRQTSGNLEAIVKTEETDNGTRIFLKVDDASLKIPGTYTVIKELSGIIDLHSTERCVIIRDLTVGLHKGSAWSSRATFYFSQEGSLEYAHIPLQCKDLLVSKHKELFGTLSGGITLTFRSGRWHCSGVLTLENAHVRSNLLSAQVQRNLMAPAVGSSVLQTVDLDLQIKSRAPIRVNTSFLSTDAYLDIILRGTADKPTLAGSIELSHGTLAFPYKPLFVTTGTLTLAPEQPDGPTINLTAKNKIRSYTVTMRVTGSLSQPSITFEASPQLSEEAIMTLLLAGSDQGSLTDAMPRMIMQQIEDLLFGSEESLSAAMQFLKGLLTPLKNVRLVKKGADQEELQAVLEVDINDRLRAKAQNNLKLSDETQLELEYVVSDDVTVKAVRDQSGTLGGEVEMRWKF